MSPSSYLLALTHARILTPTEEIEDGTVVIQDGRILRVDRDAPPPEARTLDLRGLIVAPGFVDLHTHGGGGFSLTSGDPDELRGYAQWAVSTGVTSFLIALVPAPREELVAQMRTLLPLLRAPTNGARPLGFYLEGPFLSTERPGAFDPPSLHPPDVSELRGYLDAAEGNLRVLAIAPELPGAEAVIREATAAGVVAALAHSDAGYEEAMEGFSAGISHVTHCFNAMRLFHHRDPGCLGAVLNRPSVTAEIIADGVHAHPGAIELLLRAKSAAGTVLVSDGIPLAGLSDGVFELQGAKVRVEGGVARRGDGTLAGSTVTMDRAVANVWRRLLLRPSEAVTMATVSPAAVIREGSKGRISPGGDADIVVLAPDLEVEMTFVAGREVYRRH
ncbi:MAG: N-acetylglucosamine-6-phosphate deacetylase [Dehalococcoidia bacterium]|nr:N-acetylglucosamine-6-phosphate deacetylase [Dehalococcoidia bacterium]